MCGECMAEDEKRSADAENAAAESAASALGTHTDNQLEEKLRRARCLFTGCYNHGIDSKGRMIVPSAFREQLGDTFYVAPTPDFQAIALYPVDEWLREQEMLQTLADADARAQRFINQFSKYTYRDCETDAQGRLLLPQKLRTMYLKDARDVEISGAKTHIRIVDSTVGEEEDEAFRRDIPAPLSFIAELQKQIKS